MSIKNNPFFLLNISTSASRREIIAAAEEQSFLHDASICSEAQNELVSINRRTAAEMDWFLDVDETNLNIIKSCISEQKEIPTDNLESLSRLNATLFNFSLLNNDIYELGYGIQDIDEQFSDLDEDEIINTINTCRNSAKMAVVQQAEVSSELSKKRERIRQEITNKLSGLDKSDYIELTTIIGERYVDLETEGGVIFEDILSQYEIDMQSEIESGVDSIRAQISKIKNDKDVVVIKKDVQDLISLVKSWDVLAQPLQLKSQASGMPHEISDDLAHEIRNVAFYLNNEKGEAEIALSLVKNMYSVFEEIEDLASIFDEDSEELTGIIQSHKDAKRVLDELESIKTLCEQTRKSPSDVNVANLISKVRAVNAQVKTLPLDIETIKKIRTNICMTVRDTAVDLHNRAGKTNLSLRISQALYELFSDITDIKAQLYNDTITLNRQNIYKEEKSKNSKAKLWGWLIVAIVIAVLYFTLVGGSDLASGSKSNTPVVTEQRFSASVPVGSKVYADIVSIFPEIGIYLENSTNYYKFVCSCEKSTGGTIWVVMSVEDYKKYFDSSASTSIYNEYAERKTFNTKRIHGIMKMAESVISDLSQDTGTYVIDFSSVD